MYGAPAVAKNDEYERIERQLMRKTHQACKHYGLLAPDDHIMVALSGGKDSYTMLHLLRKMIPKLPFSVKLTAVHLDQQQPNYDGAPLKQWLEDSGARYEILSEDTYTVVTDHIDSTSTYCSMCSRLRRGILYTAAERLGCNKIALGHHRNDTLETFMMNLFYAGKMQAMPAVYTTDDGRFEVIRPLIECDESQIARFSELEGFPILPCNLCGSQSGLKREAMTQMLDEMEKHNPNVRSVMMNALTNVRPTHLLDQDVLQAWQDRAPEIQPTPEPKARVEHAAAKPVASSPGLRVLP